MKSRPILFSAPMVRALLAGTKTQTRRVIKDQPSGGVQGCYRRPDGLFIWTSLPRPNNGTGDGVGISPTFACPHGAPGSQLWVRESFIHEPADYVWEASVSIPCRPASTVYRADCKGDSRGAGWTSPMFMPRSLSRITLELTDVRVERLQDISEADAQAEGVTPKWEPGCSGRLVEAFRGFSFRPAASAYADLWESINGAGSWDANPYVWALSFKRV